tara:strand:+ start:1432 stop:1908 length:477 start_codon:yes stop_codon:yes gene_type:complete
MSIIAKHSIEEKEEKEGNSLNNLKLKLSGTNPDDQKSYILDSGEYAWTQTCSEDNLTDKPPKMSKTTSTSELRSEKFSEVIDTINRNKIIQQAKQAFKLGEKAYLILCPNDSPEEEAKDLQKEIKESTNRWLVDNLIYNLKRKYPHNESYNHKRIKCD